MEARLHFESNFSGTLFRLKTTFSGKRCICGNQDQNKSGIRHKARGLQFVGHVTKIEPTNKCLFSQSEYVNLPESVSFSEFVI